MSVHNGESYTNEAINSILGQTLTDWEFLIVNDGSTDGTKTILKQYASDDSRIKILTNPKNIGLTKSLNLAIRQAKAEFIARQDADDISAPSRLEKQLIYMKTHPTIAVLGCLDSSFNEDGIIQTATDNKLSPAQIKQYLRRGNLF
ncbi:MAG: glycosyltransferase family 2 protein, partial [Sedimentisphaerales bacterium]|nr:glycosyltransferase family 2 protein [Sedimentisphaerales bacterium]